MGRSWELESRPESRVVCSPVDGRDAGHRVIVTDAFSQEPVSDLPGEHSRVLSLVFSNLVHHFGRRHFGLGASDHSGLDAAGLIVPVPGRPAGSVRTGRGRGREAAGSRVAAEPLSHPRQQRGRKRLSMAEPASGGHVARVRDGPQDEGEEERDTPSRKIVMPGAASTPAGLGASGSLKAQPFIWKEQEEQRASRPPGPPGLRNHLQPFPTEHRNWVRTRTLLSPPQC